VKIAIESQWTIVLKNGTDAERENFANHCFSVLDALGEMEDTNCGVSDADLSLNFGECRVTYSFIVDADTLDDAAQNATNIMRSAVHEAGGFTPSWEGHVLQLKIAYVEDDNEAPILTFA
jgi:hypothetical protein